MTTRRVFCSTVRLRRQSGGAHVLGRLLSLLFLYSQYCGVLSVVSIRRIWSQNLGFYSKLWFKPTEHAWRTCWCLCPADPTGQWTGWSCCPPYWRWIWLWLWSSYDQAQAGPWRQPGQSGPSPGSGNADVYLKWDERCECIPYKNSRRSKDLCGCSDFQYKTLIIFRMDILIITGPAYQIKLGSQLSQKMKRHLSYLCLSLPRPHQSEWKGWTLLVALLRFWHPRPPAPLSSFQRRVSSSPKTTSGQHELRLQEEEEGQLIVALG